MIRYFRLLVIAVFAATIGLFTYYKVSVESQIDRVSPVLTADADSIEISVNAAEEELLAGITATDDVDGDVTDSLLVESMGKFVETGTMKVSYAAFDKSGNVGKYERNVTYSDYVSPTFRITEPLRTYIYDYYYKPLNGLSAEDCIDGNITGLIKYKYGEDADFSTEGYNLISYQVTNSKGDTAKVEVYVEVLSEKEYAMPYPLLSDYLVYTKAGEKINTSSYLEGVSRNKSTYLFGEDDRYTRDMVKVNDSAVDYSTPGIYRVVYTLSSDEDGQGVENQGHTCLYVVVQE